MLMYYLLIYPSCSMYAIIHFPPKKTSIHNHLDHPPGSSHIFPHFRIEICPLVSTRRHCEVKLIDLGRSGNAGGNPQPRWRRGTQERMSPLRQRGKLGKPWGKLIDKKSSKKMTHVFRCHVKTHQLPIGSMYAIYGNIYHQYTPNVSIYTIHGSYGL